MNNQEQHYYLNLNEGLEIIKHSSNFALKELNEGRKFRPQTYVLYSLPGVGKTEGIKSIAKSDDHIKVIDINAEFGGSLSMPIQSINKENTEAKVLHALHEDIHELREHALAHPNEAHYLFLDEFNRGDEFMKQTLMQLLLNKRVPGHSLPDNVFVVGAGNTSENVFTSEILDNEVNPLDVASRDRIAPLFIKLNVDDWLSWGYKNKLNPVIMEFIDSSDNKESVLYQAPDSVDGTGATPRSWAKLSDTLKAFDLEKTSNRVLTGIIASHIGNSLTKQFKDFLFTTPPFDIDYVLADKNEAFKRFEELTNVINKRQLILKSPYVIEKGLENGSDVQLQSFLEIIRNTNEQQILQRFVRTYVEDGALKDSYPEVYKALMKENTYRSLVAQYSVAN